MSEKFSIIDWLRGWIGHIGYCLFLWSINMTHEQYVEEIYEGVKYEMTELAKNAEYPEVKDE